MTAKLKKKKRGGGCKSSLSPSATTTRFLSDGCRISDRHTDNREIKMHIRKKISEGVEERKYLLILWGKRKSLRAKSEGRSEAT